MSQSRFVLKQIPVRGSGASDLTRYVARSKLDPEREGRAARPLFTARDDGLTVTPARQWLSIVGDKWDKSDALHYVLSWASAREYEFLGADEEERREAVLDFLRHSLKEGLTQLGVAPMRWVAGLHRNTDNPHLHLLLNRYALRQDTGQLVRLGRLPAPLIAHHTRLPDGAKVFESGTIITHFAARADERLRQHARFLQYESPLYTAPLTRALLAPEILQTRSPNAAERLAGAWLLAEIAASHTPRPSLLVSPPEPLSLPANPLSGGHDVAALRAQMTRLDHLARLNGEPPVPAYLSAADLRVLLIQPPAGAVVTPLRPAPWTGRPAALEHELPVASANRSQGPLTPTPTLLDPLPRPSLR